MTAPQSDHYPAPSGLVRCTCGAVFVGKKYRRHKCPDCVSASRSRGRANATWPERDCVDCGAPFQPGSPIAKRCPTCREIENRKKATEWQRAARNPNQRRKTVQVRAGPPKYVNSNRIDCPANRMHRPRMEYLRRNGVITGRMVAWCHDCNCEIPNNSEHVA